MYRLPPVGPFSGTPTPTPPSPIAGNRAARRPSTKHSRNMSRLLGVHLVTLALVLVDQTVLVDGSSYHHHHQHHGGGGGVGGVGGGSSLATSPLRHYSAQHSRFPNLHRVHTSLNAPHHLGATATAATSDLHSPRGGLRSAATAAAPIPEYSKSAEEDDYDDDDLFEDDDEDEDEDNTEDHQSYQPHHPEAGRPPWNSEGHRHQESSQSAMSPHSQFKWTTFGNRHGIDEYRNSRLTPAGKKRPQTTVDAEKAYEHARRVYRESLCRVPKAKVINVKDIYPSPSKTYSPHCTILHQCGDDTGCCKTDSHSCVARRTHRVELYFWVTIHGVNSGTDLGSRYRQPYSSQTTVEKVVFYNHTECTCEDKNADLMPRDMEPARGHGIHESHTHFRPSQTRVHELPPPLRSNSCQCPGDFSPRILEDGTCKCECFDKQRDCLRLKRGKDYFTHQDRLCIEKKQCQVPVCEFGPYMKLSGRCMRKQEKFASWQTYSQRHDFR